MLKHPNDQYFQKSKVFLFPILGIKKSPETTPCQTYLSWGDKIKPEDKRLICLYDDSPTLDNVEEEILIPHPLFIDSWDCENNQRIYIFNLDLYSEDFQKFLRGRYSLFSEEVKSFIKQYFKENTKEYKFVHTFLFPEKYIKRYAQLLDVSPELLIEIGELCDKYDPEKENLKISVNNLENLSITP